MTADGRVCKDYKPWFGRTVIRTCCKLDYGSAQRMIDGEIHDVNTLPDHIDLHGGHSLDDVISDCRALHEIAQQRRAHRFETGSLRLDRPKMSFEFGDGYHDPISVGPYQLHDTNRLIEEYMLLANMLVAEFLVQKVPEVALLRKHEPPLENKLQDVCIVEFKSQLLLSSCE